MSDSEEIRTFTQRELLQQWLDLGRPGSRTLADLRSVSRHTIDKEFRQILQRPGARCRFEAAMIAIQKGSIQERESNP